MQRVGIIGAGSFGEQHARAIHEVDGLQVVAASRTEATALQAFVEQFDGTPYTDYQALLADANVDTVVIATPHHIHTDIVLRALQAGKHILLEKPMAPTLQECQQITDAVQATDLKFMVGHVNHFARAYQVAKQVVESGEVGEIVLGQAAVQKYWFESYRRHWHLDRATGGGVWLTVGIHPLDRMTWLIDSPVRGVAAHFSTAFHDQAADDLGLVFLRYESGAAGSVVSTGYANGAPKHLTELTGTKGMMTIDYTGGVHIGQNEAWRLLPESVPTGNWMHEALVNEWRAFKASIDDDTETPVPATFALHIMDVAFAAERSSQERREIAITSGLA
jgi:phthalate 4,5-cis-dihydrodiol dehydrogenase